MVQKRIWECSFFIPTRRDANLSDGKPHPAEVWDWLDEELYKRFSGSTQAPGLYHGFYRDPDTLQRVGDESHKFTVAVPPQDIPKLRNFLSEACDLFQQKCIYLSVAGKVEFIEAADHDTD